MLSMVYYPQYVDPESDLWKQKSIGTELDQIMGQ